VALQGMVVRYEAADDMPAIEGVPVIYGDCAFDQRGHIMSPFRAPFAVPQERQVNLDYSRTRISEEHLQGLTGIYFGFWRLSERLIAGQVRLLIFWPIACLLHNIRACLYGNPVGKRYYPLHPRGGAPTLEDYLRDLIPPPADAEDVDAGEEVFELFD